MSFYDREKQILSMLEENQVTSIHKIAQLLYVSEPTVRRDLALLVQQGKIVRTHGGASLKQQPADAQIPLFMREQEQNAAKIEIARKAAEFIEDNNTIMLDATTTAYCLLPYLANKHGLVVITSGAKTAYTLGKMGITTICTGGRMIKDALSFVGKDAEQTIANYNADIAFVSCRGLSCQGTATDNSVEENALRFAMLKNAKQKILLCDSSKFNKTCLHNLCSLQLFDRVITDTPLPPSIASFLKTDA